MNKPWHDRRTVRLRRWAGRHWREALAVGAVVLLVVVAGREARAFIADVRARFAEKDANPELGSLPPAGRAAPGVLAIGFRDLRFDAPETGDAAGGPTVRYADLAPAAVKALAGRTVRLTGYMMPTRMEGTNVRECLIVPSQLNCCFGQVPRFCEYVVARMHGADVPAVADIPLVFTGILQVGDAYDQGVWTAFYTLDCSGVGR